jgi:hypothetical protein
MAMASIGCQVQYLSPDGGVGIIASTVHLMFTMRRFYTAALDLGLMMTAMVFMAWVSAAMLSSNDGPPRPAHIPCEPGFELTCHRPDPEV